MHIVKNDPYVKELPPSAKAMLQSVIETFDFVEEVTLYQTIDCYIARFKRKHYQPHFKGHPDRLNPRQLAFLASLGRVEFIEAACDELRVCFTVERVRCLDWVDHHKDDSDT
jgi:hypothetical protein